MWPGFTLYSVDTYTGCGKGVSVNFLFGSGNLAH